MPLSALTGPSKKPRVEELQNYTILHTTAGKILARQTMSSLAEQLPADSFVRVHKSFLVLLAHMASVERSRITLERGGGQPAVVIHVGDRYRAAFYQRLGRIQ